MRRAGCQRRKPTAYSYQLSANQKANTVANWLKAESCKL
jgi:hypothetical protein